MLAEGGSSCGAARARALGRAQGSAEGCSAPRAWANAPGDAYGWHAHGYHKVLFCLDGSIVFHTRRGDVALERGDRLDLPPATEHAATVGPAGCACVEASR